MKKTLTINLAGIVYHVDEDAYRKLKQYLEALEKKFRQEPDVKDLIADIETRIAELLTERLGNKRQVVIMDDINFVIQTLGDPDVISDEDNSSNYSSETHWKTSQKKYRRMYRDPDSRIIGGVCSGLAAYWNMDPTIIRVIFVVLVLVGGSGLLIYLILWMVMPEAQTTAQKLEMRGEAVTIDNIKDFIREEFEQVKKNFKGDRK
ncbi:MAG: PspC domain-containing protein [Bacteroidales bacterium]|nr:PspC domain-containing protein [Bacteroidales bacterium]MBN2820858.1 PspC domain-containing protein [Bacteroidales bacterium]